VPVFTFANQAGLDMLETTLIALQDISLEKILDEEGRKALCSEFPKIMQQVTTYHVFYKASGLAFASFVLQLAIKHIYPRISE
jgi:MEKHLA domain